MIPPSPRKDVQRMLFGEEHVKVYEETNGEVGHDWARGAPVMILTTTGRKTGAPRKSPLIYHVDERGDYLAVATNGGSPTHPSWYLNLVSHPRVILQIREDVFPALARTATREERDAVWPRLLPVWPKYDEYVEKARATREVPLVVFSRL